MSLTVMMTSVVSDLARDTQRVAIARGRIQRANAERAEKVKSTKSAKQTNFDAAFEPFVPNGDPFEAGASIWDVLQTVRHANEKHPKSVP